MPLPLTDLLPALVTFCLVAVLTPVVRSFARRWGTVAQPRPDRWHRKPTALLGGIAIFAGAMFTVLVFRVEIGAGWIAACTFMFVVGLIDDLRRMRALPKLLSQLAAAGAVLLDGHGPQLTGVEWLDVCVAVFWLVGITNAVNLIDNMDGLAAGVGAIASASFATWFALQKNENGVLLFTILAGSLAAFLIYNFNPASIFMGDCGSQFIGFYLASAVIQFDSDETTPMRDVVTSILILFVPIFDTTFVTITRKLAGRPISQGGRDHTSHRLVAWGLSERITVIAMYAVSVVGTISALVTQFLPTPASIAILTIFSAMSIVSGIVVVRLGSANPSQKTT